MYFKVLNRIIVICLSLCILISGLNPQTKISADTGKEREVIVKFSFKNKNSNNRIRGRAVDTSHEAFIKELFPNRHIEFSPVHKKLVDETKGSRSSERELLGRDYGFTRTLKLKASKSAIRRNAGNLKSFKIESLKEDTLVSGNGSGEVLSAAGKNFEKFDTKSVKTISEAEATISSSIINNSKIIYITFHLRELEASLSAFAEDRGVELIIPPAPPTPAPLVTSKLLIANTPTPIFINTNTPTPFRSATPTTIFGPNRSPVPTTRPGQPTAFPPVPPTFNPGNPPTFNPGNPPTFNPGNPPQPTFNPNPEPTPPVTNNNESFFRVQVLDKSSKNSVGGATVIFVAVNAYKKMKADSNGMAQHVFKKGTKVAVSVSGKGYIETSTKVFKLSSSKSVKVLLRKSSNAKFSGKKGGKRPQI